MHSECHYWHDKTKVGACGSIMARNGLSPYNAVLPPPVVVAPVESPIKLQEVVQVCGSKLASAERA